jgi:hypothetical protein
MWRRLNREDLKGSNPLLDEGDSYQPWPVRWQVYEDYEIVPAPDGSDWHYIQAAGRDTDRQSEWICAYNPLIDTPYLFLEFARIAENKDPAKALEGWFRKYGLLGMTKNPSRESRQSYKGIGFPTLYHDDRGGPWDRIEVIWDIVDQYNESLILYEAVLGRDDVKLERALFPAYDLKWAEDRRNALEKRAEASGAEWTDTLINAALNQVIEYASGSLRTYAYPYIAYPEDENLTVNRLTRSWGARNLLGAMGLQFYWLITSAGELSRCKYCGRIISYAPPIPGSAASRKPRKDKEFCDSRCRQNYHYHNRIKPERNNAQR